MASNLLDGFLFSRRRIPGAILRPDSEPLKHFWMDFWFFGAGFRADFAPRFRAQNRAQIPGTLISLLTNARNLGTILRPESGRKICPESGAEKPKIHPKNSKPYATFPIGAGR